MEESKIRALILEEIQGIIDQVGEEHKGLNSPMVAAARSVGEIVAKRLSSIKGAGATANAQDQDTEIGKDSV